MSFSKALCVALLSTGAATCVAQPQTLPSGGDAVDAKSVADNEALAEKHAVATKHAVDAALAAHAASVDDVHDSAHAQHDVDKELAAKAKDNAERMEAEKILRDLEAKRGRLALAHNEKAKSISKIGFWKSRSLP